MNFRRLMISRNHNARTTMFMQIPNRVDIYRSNFASAFRYAMIRLRPRRTHPALNHIQAAHLASFRIAPLGKITNIFRRTGESSREEVGIERQNHISLREVIPRLNRLTKRQLRTLKYIVAIDRLIHMPLGFGEHREKILFLIGQRRRRERPRKNANTTAAQTLLHIQRASQSINEIPPGSNVTKIGNGLRTVRVIHLQNRSLRKYVGPAQTRGMLVIPFNLGRTIKMTLYQQRLSISTQSERGGIKQRTPGNSLFRLLNIRNNRLQRLLG